MIEKAVVNWLKTKEAHPHEITEAYAVFLKETQIDCSFSYFTRIFFRKYKKSGR